MIEKRPDPFSLSHIDRVTIDKNMFWRPTITIHVASVARMVKVIAVPICRVTAGGVDVRGVGFVAGGDTTCVNSEECCG